MWFGEEVSSNENNNNKQTNKTKNVASAVVSLYSVLCVVVFAKNIKL